MAKAEAKEFIVKKLDENKIVVFSKSYCPYCTMAKEALNDICKDYLCIEIEDMPNCSAIQDALCELTGARSVPRVFINKKCIGGGTETKNMKASGELQKLIAGS